MQGVLLLARARRGGADRRRAARRRWRRSPGSFSIEVQATAREFFAPVDDNLLSLEMAPIMAFAAMQGLALDRIVWPADEVASIGSSTR